MNSLRCETAKNIIVTGIPRSGTTLVCALLNSLENTICLREPDTHVQWLRQVSSAAEYTAMIQNDFQCIRKDIKSGQPVLDRSSINGGPLTNYFPKRDTVNERRSVSFEMKAVDTAHLTKDFTLAVKHNVEYTSVLPALIESQQFSFLCPIRNPIGTILSWNTLQTPVSKGAIPMAQYFWPEVDQALKNTDELLHRQVVVFDMFCKRFYEFKNHINIIYYEDLVDNAGVLSSILGQKEKARIEIKSGNNSKQYDWALAQEIHLHIKRYAKYIPYFYSNSALEGFVARI